ncbi:MAG: diadenylate cyclase CdaA, partial [Clostridia bacterium]|nr:diadenylate cyclase CdaA [Clostridia bacterium]
DLLNMQASSYIMSRLFKDIVLVLIFLFQPEIRHALESVGRSRFSGAGFLSSVRDGLSDNDIPQAIEHICKACSDMSDKKIGALIVYEKETMLGEIISTGSTLDAVVSAEMIENIFYPKAPLHDGAAIIRGNRVAAAGCILPLTDNSLSSELGTRHRAAVGMSEKCDAAIIVVSEETGGISLAMSGRLKRNISDGQLRELLTNYLVEHDKNGKKGLKRLFASKKNFR